MMKVVEIRRRIEQVKASADPQAECNHAEIALLKDFIRGLTKGFINGINVRSQAKEIVELIGEK